MENIFVRKIKKKKNYEKDEYFFGRNFNNCSFFNVKLKIDLCIFIDFLVFVQKNLTKVASFFWTNRKRYLWVGQRKAVYSIHLYAEEVNKSQKIIIIDHDHLHHHTTIRSFVLIGFSKYFKPEIKLT